MQEIAQYYLPISAPPAQLAEPSLKDRVKLSLGALLFPAQTRRWRGYVSSHPLLGELAAHYPRVLHKIYRPYLSNHLDCAARVDAMIGHYDLVMRAGLSALVRSAALQPVTLAAFEGKGGVPFVLRLSAVNVAHREGEMSLQLVTGSQVLYTATFSLVRSHGGHVIKLYSLQGLRSECGAASMRSATRELHGCRPRSLMVYLVRRLGDWFGCQSLHLVSNENRIAINAWRRRRISADYDQAWTEMAAHRRGDGNFELPCRVDNTLDLSHIPSHKRSEARKRHALLSAAADVMLASLDRAALAQ